MITISSCIHVCCVHGSVIGGLCVHIHRKKLFQQNTSLCWFVQNGAITTHNTNIIWSVLFQAGRNDDVIVFGTQEESRKTPPWLYSSFFHQKQSFLKPFFLFFEFVPAGVDCYMLNSRHPLASTCCRIFDITGT